MGSVVGVYVKDPGLPSLARRPVPRRRIERPRERTSRALLILSAERVAALRTAGWPLELGKLGEDLVTCGLPQLAFGARLRVGRQLVLEISGDCEPCIKVFRLVEPARRAALHEALSRGGRGWLARVLEPGEVGVGDTVGPVENQLAFG